MKLTYKYILSQEKGTACCGLMADSTMGMVETSPLMFVYPMYCVDSDSGENVQLKSYSIVSQRRRHPRTPYSHLRFLVRPCCSRTRLYIRHTLRFLRFRSSRPSCPRRSSSRTRWSRRRSCTRRPGCSCRLVRACRHVRSSSFCPRRGRHRHTTSSGQRIAKWWLRRTHSSWLCQRVSQR